MPTHKANPQSLRRFPAESSQSKAASRPAALPPHDARGNAEALFAMRDGMALEIDLR
jgi:hypothetical protein